MEFSLPFHPNNIATLLDNPTHWLRSVIQFKWSIAELEMYRIRVLLIGENKRVRGDITRDIDDLWKERKNTKVRRFKDALSDVRSAYKGVVNDRNTITHGSMEFTDPVVNLHVTDSRFPTTSEFFPFYRPGCAVMVRQGKQVSQDPITLREINKKADKLLQAIYAMWIAINPSYGVNVDLRIDNGSDPNIGFGPRGEKNAHGTSNLNLSDILNQEETSHYVCNTCGKRNIANLSQEPMCCNTRMVKFTWKECPECGIAAIENGAACWHMIVAEHYENGESLNYTIRIPNARSILRNMLEQSNGAGADDLVLEIPIATTSATQMKYKWVN